MARIGRSFGGLAIAAVLMSVWAMSGCGPVPTGRTTPDGQAIYDRADRTLRTMAPDGVYELRLYALPEPVRPERPPPRKGVRNPDGTVSPPVWTPETERELMEREKALESFDPYPGLDTFGDLPRWTLHLPNRSLEFAIYSNPEPGDRLPREPETQLSGGVHLAARRMADGGVQSADFGEQGAGVFSIGLGNVMIFPEADCDTTDELRRARGMDLRSMRQKPNSRIYSQLDGWLIELDIPTEDLEQRQAYCDAAAVLLDRLTVSRDVVAP